MKRGVTKHPKRTVHDIERTPKRRVQDIHLDEKPRWRATRYPDGRFNFKDHPNYVKTRNWLVGVSFLVWLLIWAALFHLFT
jgi:hypothetical protein